MRCTTVWVRPLMVCALGLLACSKQSADDVLTPAVNISNGAFVPNQISGSITYVPRAATTGQANVLITDVYQKVNNRVLGGQPVHLARQGERIYIALQDQNRLEVVNARTFRSEASITGLNAPVFILAISDAKLYVAETNANLGTGLPGTIAVVNLTTNTVNATRIAAGGAGPRKLVQIGSKVYVQYATTPASPNLTVIDLNTDVGAVLNVPVPRAVDAIADAQGFLWVAQRGDLPMGSTLRDAGTVVRINVNTAAVERTVAIAESYVQPVYMATNADGSMLYFTAVVDGTQAPKLYKYNVAVPATPTFVSASPSSGVTFDAATGTPLLYSVRSAVQNPTSATGQLVRFNAGTLAAVDSFGVQIQPVQVFF